MQEFVWQAFAELKSTTEDPVKGGNVRYLPGSGTAHRQVCGRWLSEML